MTLSFGPPCPFRLQNWPNLSARLMTLSFNKAIIGIKKWIGLDLFGFLWDARRIRRNPLQCVGVQCVCVKNGFSVFNWGYIELWGAVWLLFVYDAACLFLLLQTNVIFSSAIVCFYHLIVAVWLTEMFLSLLLCFHWPKNNKH